MSDIEVTMDCDKCKAYQYEQGRKDAYKDMTPFTVIKFSKEDLQEMVEEKVKEFELDIAKIRTETKKEILAFCKEAYHLKEVIEFLEQDLNGK